MQFDMDLSLGFILNRTSIQSKALFTQKIKEFDISPEQWSLVFRVVESNGLTQKELSDSTYKDQANITRSIDRLERKGLLKRVSNQMDRRIINIYPTEKAINLVEKIIPISSRFNNYLTENFTEEEKNQLIKLLNKVYENLLKGDINESKK
ncbi:MarR family winged helix-turn-helix transcriptional regulator [Aliarcobacter butzleri]|uniref:MarR family winged helix-turn-helix transcriptional regulator n=1 Tax=Aliarcobacter butzleri TaxID=28197 RepID=UPI00126052EA|nr:MarR family winged helix-turn-helix transcriptional regulator [Aliarcobacter butzleri]MCT7557875.1 MarR family winged helix-turn-helix transcriptional regulator [Aliarcobacter butzleri]MCT7595619.1 MarR family winged helix-turn-helix transcriptional regulator [Aliarcobacter butzleri]MDK2083819.1 MarR family winged helix-turn-helix transcriptional regulator [Aliarcobacter butzleri]